MILLGFADCVLNLRWRYKLIMPFLAALPLVVCYNGTTKVLLPTFLRPYAGPLVEVGILYYLYMLLYAVFTSNAINIYAGVNGIEVGQSIVTAAGVALYNALVCGLLTDSGTVSTGREGS
jgi:UDP-N-acetylglucosamine--dolichyl-phosphate N-acetylglucosaminephosphotransferase